MTKEKITPSRVKRLYEIHRRRADPGYLCGSKFDQYWIGLAKTIDDLEANPVIYMEAIFEGWDGASVPFPPQLGSKRAVEAYKKYLELGKTVGERTLEAQAQVLASNLRFYRERGQEKTVDELLLSDYLPVFSFFRCIVCGEDSLEEILFKHKKRAIAEIQSQPSLKLLLSEKYKKRFNRLFPQRLSERATSASSPMPRAASKSCAGGGNPRRRRSSNLPSHNPSCKRDL